MDAADIGERGETGERGRSRIASLAAVCGATGETGDAPEKAGDEALPAPSTTTTRGDRWCSAAAQAASSMSVAAVFRVLSRRSHIACRPNMGRKPD